MRAESTATKYPGVRLVQPGRYRVRAKFTDPKTGRPREVDQVIEATSAKEAAALRASLIDGEAASGARPRLTDFAQSWMRSTAPSLDEASARNYAQVLEHHILPVLGDYYLDALTQLDVQEWVNACLRKKWGRKGKQTYSVETVKSWFRVLCGIVHDAMVAIDLPRDPTLRIKFGEQRVAGPGKRDKTALTPEQLAAFLDAMRTHHPSHYGLAATLAFTGLRFCHASGLRWEDIDEEAGVIRIGRKNIRGRVGEVSRVKKAPRVLPLAPELAAILKEHRQWMVFKQVPGLDDGWVFPSRVGTLRTPSTLNKARKDSLKRAGLPLTFTSHGLRRTFNDLSRRAGIDAIVTRSLTGHVTERMQEHYSTVGIDEKKAAMAEVLRLVPTKVGTEVGTASEKKKAG
jgi:integrase